MNLSQINNLKIDNKPQPPTTSTINYPTVSLDERNDQSSSTGTLTALNGAKLTVDHVLRAQKFCKWASSALDYEDISTAAQNLEKALNILHRGIE